MPSLLVDVTTGVFYFAFIVGIVFVVGILLGFIKPSDSGRRYGRVISQPDKLLTHVSLHETVGEFEIAQAAFDNPHFMWATRVVDTPVGIKRVPFPVFRWWVFENLNNDLKNKVGQEVLRKYGNELAGSRLYVASILALDFLSRIRDELQELKIEVYLYDPFRPPPPPAPNQKVVLFDVSTSTGTSFQLALNSLRSEHTPSLFLAVVVNDFVPPTERNRPWIKLGAEFKFLYRASDLIRHLEGEKEMAQGLLTVRDALYGEADWRESRVEQSLETLRKVLN